MKMETIEACCNKKNDNYLKQNKYPVSHSEEHQEFMISCMNEKAYGLINISFDIKKEYPIFEIVIENLLDKLKPHKPNKFAYLLHFPFSNLVLYENIDLDKETKYIDNKIRKVLNNQYEVPLKNITTDYILGGIKNILSLESIPPIKKINSIDKIIKLNPQENKIISIWNIKDFDGNAEKIQFDYVLKNTSFKNTFSLIINSKYK